VKQDVFLTAEWKHLLMLNYRIEPAVLQPFVPGGTELDVWNGNTYVSIVAFMFLNTRVCGLPIPMHQNFEEVNLRFYVKRRPPEGTRRGVVFIKELVPRATIATVARVLYNEPYTAVPMRHTVSTSNGALAANSHLKFEWKTRGRWNSVSARLGEFPEPLQTGSEAEFITEHYWGYTHRRDGRTWEYEVEHPRWNVWPLREARLDCDVVENYGIAFQQVLTQPYASAFVAAGSQVAVRKGLPIT
jgi:uncharacterized protein YqjF (DUF2071 family)